MTPDEGAPTCLCVVTARGGSKGVPDKNLRLLHGRPVISYTLQVARSCGRITRTVVTTDSERIRRIALDEGAEAPFLRPPELATDLARQEDAILHAMAWYEARGEVFDYVCLLEPTVPLRQAATVARGFSLLESTAGAEAAFSIAESHVSPEICSTLPADGFMSRWMREENKWLNRQEMTTYYQLSPLMALSKWAVFKREKTFLHATTAALIVDAIEGWDIDAPVDFVLIERLLENGLVSSNQIAVHLSGRASHS